MKCLVSKGFKYLVALFIILSCVSVRAMAKETNDTADQSNRITEKGNTSKDETFDTNDELMSNDPKKSISSQDSASDRGKNEASSTKDSVKTEYTFEDSKIKVKAVLKKADAVSDQAELKVKEIPENTTEYKKYENALNKKDNAYSNVLLYDISFMLNGKEVEPVNGSVKVSMEFKDQQLSDDLKVKSASDLKVIHFKDNDVNKQESLTPTTNVKSGTTSFETKSFSAYAVVKENQDVIAQKEMYYTNNFKDPDLGYGITANSIHQTGDTETNVFTGLYDSDVKELGASGSKSSFGPEAFSNAGGYNYIGDFGTRFQKDGNGKYLLQFYMQPKLLTLGSSAALKYKNGQYSIRCADTNSEIESSLINYESNTEIDSTTKMNKKVENQLNKMKEFYTNVITSSVESELGVIDTNFVQGGSKKLNIDLREASNGTYIIKYTGNYLDTDNITIYLNKGQNIIFYCTTSQTLNLGRFTINGIGTGELIKKNGEDYDWLTNAASFYAPNATELNFNGSVCGIFLAPNANVTKSDDSTSAGILGCKNFGTSEKPLVGEWHYRNHHLPSPADVQLEGQKKFKDNTWPETGNYTLNLTTINNARMPSDGNSLVLSKTSRSGKFGKITYPATTDSSLFKHSKYYYYKIEESNDNSISGVTYDNTIYYVRVKVSYSSNGSATVTGTYKTTENPFDSQGNDTGESNWKSFEETDPFVFNNIYNTSSASADLSITKTVNGSAPGDKKFKFSLEEGKNENGKFVKTSLVQENVKNDSSGNVAFKKLNYTDAGTHYYRIYETNLTEEPAENYIPSGDIYAMVEVKKDKPTSITYYSDSAFSNKIIQPIINNVQKTDFVIKKYDADNSSKYLGNAKFELYKVENNNRNLLVIDSKEEVKQATSNNIGEASFSNLLYGNAYVLEEVKAPNGYQIAGPWLLEISKTGHMSLTKLTTYKEVEGKKNVFTFEKSTSDNQEKEAADILNDPMGIADQKKEYTLPSTGGNGTNIYYQIGMLLSVLGIIYVVFKKGKGGLLRNKKNL